MAQKEPERRKCRLLSAISPMMKQPLSWWTLISRERTIWLSRLSDELLEMVDSRKLGFSQGVDISFLSEEAQQWVEVIIEERGCNVSTVQSGKLKEYGKSGELTLAMVRLILTEEKPKERKVTLKADKISKYFSDSYSNEEIENIIISLLDKWREEGAV